MADIEKTPPEKIPNTVVGDWAGQPNYLCKECQFATTEAYRMKEHQFQRNHLWPYPQGQDWRSTDPNAQEIT